jgi:putative membrane protein
MTDAFGAIGVFVALLFQEGHDRGGHEWVGLWWPGLVITFLFFGGLVALIAWLVARIFPKVRGDVHPGVPRDSAEEILRERFARGEITAEEFGRSLEVLRTGTARRTTEADTRDASESEG